jgi:hypothetical protein
MLLKMKARPDKERLDRAQQNLLTAVKVSEEEINAVAGSPELYDGLRLRIAAGRSQLLDPGTAANDMRAGVPGRRHLTPALPAWPYLRWILAAAAILTVAVLATLLLSPRQPGEPTIAPVLPQLVPVPAERVQPGGGSTGEQIAQIRKAEASQARRISHRRHRRDGSSTEVATDFFPLTYTADSAAPESGHLVRIKISRTALLAVGLPMNVARAGELITADVVIGDDGLARAIRFIQ